MLFKEDFMRYFITKNKIEEKNKKIRMQQEYCRRSIKKDTKHLTQKQIDEIKEQWSSIAFAYPVDYEWHRLYSDKTGKFSINYIPNELHYYFTEYKLINFNYLRAFTDKNYLSLIFNDIKQPENIVRCINGMLYNKEFETINIDESINIIRKNIKDGIVIKPSISSWGGRNISFFNKEMTSQEIVEILKDYGKNFVIQKVLKQHKDLANIHKESVNTIRVLSMYIDKKVNILSACLRMGVGSAKVDNFSQGGIGCGIKEDGQLRSVGYDRNGNRVEIHPDGFNFEDCIIPNFQGVINSVKKAALKVPMFGVVSWDFAIDEEGDPVLIEYNVGGGGIDIHQYNNGPLYGEKTKQIIDDVFENYSFEDATIQYNYLVFRDHITIKNATKKMPLIYVNKKHHNIFVTRIGEKAFANAKAKIIHIPNCIENIDYCAFYNCKNLRYINIPCEIKVIGRSAFSGCIKLKKIVLPNGTKEIRKFAFRNINNLDITIPVTVEFIDEDAFLDCKNINIKCIKNSYAHQFSLKHSYKIKLM